MANSSRSIDLSVKILSMGMCLYTILYFTKFLNLIGIEPNYTAHRAIFLAFLLLLIFVLFPARRGTKREKVPWYDIIFMALALGACLYPVFFFDLYTSHGIALEMTIVEKVFGFAVIILILEGARRVIGLPITVIGLFFAIYPLCCQYFPGVLHGRGYSLDRVTATMYLHSEGILGTAVGIAATVIIAFIILSQIFIRSGAGDAFNSIAIKLTGRTVGGAAKSSIVASGLVGMIMGSGVANVATTGPYTIPLMKRQGYRPEVAGAVECVASNGGHFMPPVMGATVFIMAEFTGIPYGQICVYAAIPAILYYVCLFFQVDLTARRDRMIPDKTISIPSTTNVLKQSLPFIPPLLVLIWLLIVLGFSIPFSVSVTILTLLLFTQFRKKTRFSGRDWVYLGVDVGKVMCQVGIACAIANVIMASVFLTGIGQRIAVIAIQLASGNSMILLLITALGCYILGMGSGAIVLYITVALLIIPALIKIGIILIAAHLFAYMMACTAFITPPVALNCFVAAPIAGASVMRVGWESMKLGIIIYIIPFVFCYRPELLTIGSPTQVIIGILIVTAAAFVLAAALVGYLFRRLNWMVRGILGLVATALFIPNWQFNIAGAVVGVALILWLAISRQRALIPQVEK